MIQIEHINKKKFIKTALSNNIETCIIDITFLNINYKMLIYLIKKIQIVLLMTKKNIISTKYLEFANVFLKKSALNSQK